MASNENKVRFGTKAAYAAVRDGNGTYGEIHRLYGVESVDLSGGTGDRQVIYADDSEYFVKNGTGSQEVSVQFAKLDRWFQTEVLGHKIDETTGGVLVSESDQPSDFAFGFETTGDTGSIRSWLFCCTSSEPGFSASTNTDSISEAPDSATFTAKSALMGDGKEHTRITVEPGDTGYNGFFSAVPLAAEAAGGD